MPTPIALIRAGTAAGGTAALLLGAAVAGCTARQQDRVFRGEVHDYRVTTVASGFDHPWGMAFLPGGDILVTERSGRLRIVRDGVLDPNPVVGTPEVAARGQGGLLDVAIHPDYDATPWVYLSYSKPSGGLATTAVVRGRFDGKRLTDVERVFEANARTSTSRHFGSRLVFGPAGHLFVSVGDRGLADQAQNRVNHEGTINRILDDGRIPGDNPFVGQTGVEPSIYAYGVRNPQGLAIHPVTGALWETEHGPRGGDELNLIEAGRNYGWPVISWGIDYSGRPIGDGIQFHDGMEQPVHYWVPSIATSGLAIYAGDRFPGWRGNALAGGLAGEHIARVVLDGARAGHEERLLARLGRRIRDVRVGPDGYVYVLEDEGRASLLRIEPADAASR